MSHQEQIIVNELDKNPNIRITDLENMTGLPIGEVCKIRYFWKLEKKREIKQFGPSHRREGQDFRQYAQATGVTLWNNRR